MIRTAYAVTIRHARDHLPKTGHTPGDLTFMISNVRWSGVAAEVPGR